MNEGKQSGLPSEGGRKMGYKKTKLGWIPAKWEVKRLDMVAHIQKGIAKGRKMQGEIVRLPYMRVANVQDGYLDLSTVKKIKVPKEEISKYLLKYGDVLLTEGGDYDKLGRGTVWKNELENCVHQNHIFAVRTNPEILLPKFLSELSSSYYGRKYFMLSSKQSTNLASINSTQLKAFPVPLPPLPEQQKIAAILSTWDKAIEKLGKLIEAKEEQKKGVMQQLLIGKERVKGFNDKWNEVTLGTFLIKHHEKTKRSDQYPVLTSSRKGIFLQKNYYLGRNVASTDTTGYNVVPIGYFTYRHMSDDFEFKFNINTIVEKGIVSTLYPVFITKNINKNFVLLKLNEGQEFKRYARKQKQGGSRTYMYFSKLSKLKILVPTIEEQNQIVKIITCANQEINILKEKHRALKEQKKGLIQQLLTGKIRVTHK